MAQQLPRDRQTAAPSVPHRYLNMIKGLIGWETLTASNCRVGRAFTHVECTTHTHCLCSMNYVSHWWPTTVVHGTETPAKNSKNKWCLKVFEVFTMSMRIFLFSKPSNTEISPKSGMKELPWTTIFRQINIPNSSQTLKHHDSLIRHFLCNKVKVLF